jgi:hypothetical protein
VETKEKQLRKVKQIVNQSGRNRLTPEVGLDLRPSGGVRSRHRFLSTGGLGGWLDNLQQVLTL